jgi:hypothetical protein
MDRKSRRARKLAATGATALGLAAALALSVPTAASAQHGVDHNCGNFEHSDPVFGSPYDGHHRHRGAFHPMGYRIDAPVDPRDDHGTDDHGTDDHGTDDHGTDHRDADGPLDQHGDNTTDHDGDRDSDQNRDDDHHGDHEADHHGDHDGDHRGDRHGDLHGDHSDDHSGDPDNRDADERDSAYHGTWNGNGGGGDEGSYNCDNFDHRGKQMYIPPSLFDDGGRDGDGPRR